MGVKVKTPSWGDYINPCFGNWISVEDALPEKRVFDDLEETPVGYLGLLKHGVFPLEVHIDEYGQWFIEEVYSNNKHYLTGYEEVTHWMPMPEVPKHILNSRK